MGEDWVRVLVCCRSSLPVSFLSRLDCERYQRDLSQLSRQLDDLRQQLQRIPLIEEENKKLARALGEYALFFDVPNRAGDYGADDTNDCTCA